MHSLCIPRKPKNSRKEQGYINTKRQSMKTVMYLLFPQSGLGPRVLLGNSLWKVSNKLRKKSQSLKGPREPISPRRGKMIMQMALNSVKHYCLQVAPNRKVVHVRGPLYSMLPNCLNNLRSVFDIPGASWEGRSTARIKHLVEEVNMRTLARFL